MRSHWLLLGSLGAVLICLAQEAACGAAEKDVPPPAEAVRYYAEQVQPILAQHCLKCHGGGKKIKGGLRLTSREALLSGGEQGPVVDLEQPMRSRLLEAINYKDKDLEMPPAGKLAPEKIAVLTRWVEMKVPYAPGAAEAEPAKPARKTTPQVNEQTRNFWSFRPVVRPPAPKVGQSAWVRSPIDAFILAGLEKAGLKPAPPATRQVLIRRAYYDLIGLPPSPEEVAAFVADRRGDAFERLVDRLLASPQYGERWGRHWLDLVRYAETNSYERDNPKPNAWGYRDYVIRSLNEDKPYDRFVCEQLAGDELPDGDDARLAATGFYRLGIWDDEPSDPEQARYDDLDDVMTTVGQVFLGLTVNCARCHDHKLDPIPQRDYYRMLAFFAGVTRYGEGKDEQTIVWNSLRPLPSQQHSKLAKEVAKQVAAQLQRLNEIRNQLFLVETLVVLDLDSTEREEFKVDSKRPALLEKRVPRLLSRKQFDEYLKLRDEQVQLASHAPPALPMVLCVTEQGPKPPDTFVLGRGSARARGEKVEPGFLSIVDARPAVISTPDPGAATCGRRLALARWIASRDNPLTARVMANRVWQYHFGRGIVRSSNNFGLQGTAPTHPELLDYLADELVAHGWRLKPLHRQIMLSSAYQMASTASAEGLARDHDNDLFWRFDMRRLEAEEIRDSILAINGTLNPKMGGPSIYPAIPREVLAGQTKPGDGWHESPAAERNRRSIYVHQKRSLPLPIIETFDAAEMDGTCPVRFASTQPTQALSMINGAFMFDQAGELATYIETHAPPQPRDRVALALRRALQREPSEAEIERGMRLLDSLVRDQKLSPHEALRRVALVVYNLNEFIYLD